MADQSVQGAPGSVEQSGNGPAPAGGRESGSPPAGTLLVVALTVYLFAVTAGALWLLLVKSPVPALLGQTGNEAPVSTDWQMLHLVIAMGALGSVIHAATSLADYVGNRGLVRSWALWFVMRPLTGVLLAVVFFFLLRMGVVQPSANAGASALNPIAIGALSGLVGMFSKQAIDKLAEVFDTLFQGRHDEDRKDKLPKSEGQAGSTKPATIASALPATLAKGQQDPVLTLTGQGFGATPQATVNGSPRGSSLNGDGSLKVTLTAQDVAAAGSLQVAVLPGGNAALASPPVTVTVQ